MADDPREHDAHHLRVSTRAAPRVHFKATLQGWMCERDAHHPRVSARARCTSSKDERERDAHHARVSAQAGP
eukprot:951698-Pelagomonas_calceolata.AAC.4